MQRSIATNMDDIESCTETVNLIASTPSRLSDHEVDKTRSVSITCEEVVWQIRVVTDPLTQQLAHLCELICELKKKQTDVTNRPPDSEVLALRQVAAAGLTPSLPPRGSELRLWSLIG